MYEPSFLGVIHYRDIRNPIFNSPPKIQEKPSSHPQTPHPGHTRATATHPTAPSLGTGAVFLLKTAPANHSKSQQTCCLGASASLGVGWRNERFNDSYLPFWIPSASCASCFLQGRFLDTPQKNKHVPFERCSSYWNSPFLGDMLVFGGVTLKYMVNLKTPYVFFFFEK